MCSIMSEKPGPEVTVKALAPPHTAPWRVIDAASSSSIWMKRPPTSGTRLAKRSTTSVDGVIGYPAAKRAPAASAPSQQAWSPSRKCTPVRTPRGSACIIHLRSRVRFRRGKAIAEDREIGTVHAAQIAAAALLSRDQMRRVISLGVERGGERENFGWTKFHAEAAGLAALHHDGNRTFSYQEHPHGGNQRPARDF